MFKKFLTVFLLLLVTLVADVSGSKFGPANVCRKRRQIANVTFAETVLDVPHLVSSEVVLGCAGGCGLSFNQGNSFGVGGSGGFLPGFDPHIAGNKIGSLTANLNFAVTLTNTDTAGINVGCPAGTRCGLQARPILVHMKGTVTWKPGKITCTDPPIKDFEWWVPELAEGTAKRVPRAKVLYSGCFVKGYGPKVRDPQFDYPFCPDSLNPSDAKSTMTRRRRH